MSAESAVFVDDTAILNDLDGDFDRVYFGNEFCDKRLPGPEAVRDAYAYCRDRGLDMTLVTPVVTAGKTEAVSELLAGVESIAPELELVFNDWGVYRMATEQDTFQELVAGRILSGQKRDPAITHLSEESSVGLQADGQAVRDGVADHFRKSVVNVPYARDHFESLDVSRVELDVLSHGVYDESVSFSASLYYPWTYVSMKRWCRESTTTPLCGERCDPVVYALDNEPVMPERLYRKNNVVFSYNESVPDVEYVDREVYVPEPIN